MFYEINNVEYDSRRRVHTIEEYGVSSRLTNMTLHGNIELHQEQLPVTIPFV